MCAKNISRRQALKTLGILPIGLSLGSTALANANFEGKELTYESLYRTNLKPEKKVTAIVLGAGDRGRIYSGYATLHPDEFDVVGVAEPIEIRRKRFSEKHQIAKENQFHTWEDVFKTAKFADAIIVTTPDNLHYGPAMKALEMGYDLLLEKPIAPTWKECKDILDQATKYNRIVAVCHVLRYAPYFRKIKEVIESGALGKVVSMQHMEPIEHVHMSHSYVRGNWRNSDETTPILLAKSCHDLDIMRWWLDEKCTKITAFGTLTLFKKENAPEGSTKRCTDGCAIEKECPYSALKIYHRKKSWLHHFDLSEDKSKHDDEIMKLLKEGPYGRCVYHSDNNQPDHMVVSMQFDKEITANFNLEAFTHDGGRKTRVMGTMGYIEGDGTEMIVADFKTDKITKWNDNEHYEGLSGHGGGDMALAKDFIMAVSKQDPSLLTSTLKVSMDSHYMGYMAEKSRHNGEIVTL